MEEARLLIEDIQRPRYPFIETVMGRPLVLIPELSTREELLLVLYDSHSWSGTVSLQEIYEALDRRTKSAVRNAVHRLRAARKVEGSAGQGYALTRTGLQEAIKVVRKVTEENDHG